VLAGSHPLADTFTSDKKILSEDLKTLIDGDLWKKEAKAAKKE
jgi:hypothetical protein